MERLIQDRPTLIMLDEIARYLSAAKAKRVEESNLAKQVIAFLFSLMDCAAACNNLVFVYSLASSSDTFGVCLAVLFESLKRLSKPDRIAQITEGVRAMSNEEAHYWFAKLSQDQRRSAQKAIRVLLGD